MGGIVGEGGDHQALEKRHVHGLLQAKPGACQRAPHNGGDGQQPQQLHGGGRLLILQGHDQGRQQEQAAVSGVADDHGKEQGEEAQKPEGNVILPVAGNHAQDVEHRDHQTGDLVVLDLGGDLVVIGGGVLHGPGPVRLGGGLFEALHLRCRDIARQPHQAILALGRVADGGILRGVLGLEHLVVDAGQVPGSVVQLRLTDPDAPVAVLPLLVQLLQALFGDGELGDGIRDGQGPDGGQGGHLSHRGQPDHTHVRVRRQGGRSLFVRAVNVDIQALVPQRPQLRRGEGSPFGQPLRSRMDGGLLLLQGLVPVYAGGQVLVKDLKFLVGQQLFFRLLSRVFLEKHLHPGQLREALQMPLVGAGLFAEVDDAQGAQPVQQGGFLRRGRHNVDDLHFFDHRLTSCSFFLAILPRTTAEVCWSPR